MTREEAYSIFQQGRQARPDDPLVYDNLCTVLIELGRLEEAIIRYREAVFRFSNNAELHHNFGWLLERMQRLEEAVFCYRRASQLNPQSDQTLNNLANCLQSLGHFEQAHVAYRQAIDLAPEKILYYRNMVQSDRLPPDDPYFIAMLELARRSDTLSVDNRVELHFALAQALASNGQHAEAFNHALQANKLHRAHIDYDEDPVFDRIRQLTEILTADKIAATNEFGNQNDSPIFIIGMPRSGSSLIEQILAAHPHVLGLGERTLFDKAIHKFNLQDPQTLNTVSGGQLLALGTDYLRAVRAAEPNAQRVKRVTDKCLSNFLNVGLIHLALPNAKFIHCRRSPVETCLSIYSRIFNDVPFSYDLGELGRYYRNYEALMAHWTEVLPKGVMLDIQYEDLVDDLSSNVHSILAHCGLDWNDQCLEYHKTKRTVRTASVAQVREPIFRTSLERWRPSVAVMQPLYDGLGPELISNYRK
jgi:Flp pilus assembly protein TadD/LPS sulfotransferase NodH